MLDDIFWFEEPLPAEDVSGHSKVKAHTSIPIALGESLFNRGGITEWLKIAHMADCWNMQASPHFVMELHLPLL